MCVKYNSSTSCKQSRVHTHVYQLDTYYWLSQGLLLIPRGHQEDLDGIASFELYLYPMFTANILKPFIKPFNVRHQNVNVVFLLL